MSLSMTLHLALVVEHGVTHTNAALSMTLHLALVVEHGVTHTNAALSMTLHLALVVEHGVTHTTTANLLSTLIGRSARTVRGWKYTFFYNDGSFPDSKHGGYRREGHYGRMKN